MEQLLIFPYNGNGLEAFDCAKEQYEVIGFIDDTPEKQGFQEGLGVEVFPRSLLTAFPQAKVLAVPGSPASYRQRQMLIESLELSEERFATVIHPKACVSSLARIGYNVLIMAGAVVTGNAVLGNHLCVLPNTVIHHDVRVDDYTLIGANVTIAGYSSIGWNCYIGSGSRVINNIEIGDFSLVGMGANVIADVPSRKKVVGNPAQVIGDV